VVIIFWVDDCKFKTSVLYLSSIILAQILLADAEYFRKTPISNILINAMRLLLIEDDIKIAQFVTNGLREAGFAVDCATDGQEGLREIGTEFDLAAQADRKGKEARSARRTDRSV